MNDYIKIIENNESKLEPEVEKVFNFVESEASNPNYDKYNEAAKKEELTKVKEQAVQELKNLKIKFEKDCKREIENHNITIPNPTITNSYSLEVTRYKLIGMEEAEQLEYLRNTLNAADFEITRGMLLDLHKNDSATIRAIKNIKLADQKDLKKAALGMLQIKCNDYGYMPGIKIGRSLGIINGGLERYVDTLLGLTTAYNYFK